MKPPYKNASNSYITFQLFQENFAGLMEEKRSIEKAPFTLYSDRPGYINFGKAYVESNDPTGYTVAKELLGDYRHWQVLMKCKWFQEAKAVWDEELDAKLKSEGFAVLREMAKGDDAKALQAAKYLANLEYKPRGESKRRVGRPSKEEVQGALKAETDAEKALQADLDRIQQGNPKLKVIK